MADFSGFSPSPEIARLITEQHLGGVLLFQKNIESPAQVARLCRDLQDLARQAGSPPLLIAVDQEGGPVERLPLGLPGAMALGATRSAAFAEEAGRITGRALRAVGCNVDFAPVLDVNSNPANPIIGVRSFARSRVWWPSWAAPSPPVCNAKGWRPPASTSRGTATRISILTSIFRWWPTGWSGWRRWSFSRSGTPSGRGSVP